MTAGSVVNMPLKNCLEKDKRELGFGQNVGEDCYVITVHPSGQRHEAIRPSAG